MIGTKSRRPKPCPFCRRRSDGVCRLPVNVARARGSRWLGMTKILNSQNGGRRGWRARPGAALLVAAVRRLRIQDLPDRSPSPPSASLGFPDVLAQVRVNTQRLARRPDRCLSVRRMYRVEDAADFSGHRQKTDFNRRSFIRWQRIFDAVSLKEPASASTPAKLPSRQRCPPAAAASPNISRAPPSPFRPDTSSVFTLP